MQEKSDLFINQVFSLDDPDVVGAFNSMMRDFYAENRRPMPWRDEITPYRVVVSEVMLQQTQVSRVLQKFPGFIEEFPDFRSLADASLEELLRAWQGLGYNRRAKHLQGIAREVMGRFGSVLPKDPTDLLTLPGIGKATAGSIAAFAFNQPALFIETNIRRVFLHHFFQDRTDVPDSDILPVVARMMDRENPREWYYALMDYGTYLSGHVPNPNRRSLHYSVQSSFSGSDREIRGKILKILLEEGPMRRTVLVDRILVEPGRLEKILNDMVSEKFLELHGDVISFCNG